MQRISNRRSLLQLLATSAAACALPCLASAQDAARPSSRPNIVLIMADDMGFSDLGCYGSEISTPNLDRLAADGMRFTQFYNMGRCCPTRASLLTGLYPHQAGIGHMVENTGSGAYQGYLNESCVTIAQALRPAGYRTLMTGKWHVGKKRPNWPTDRGFDQYYGLIDGACNYFRIAGRTLAQDQQPTSLPSDTFYLTDVFTDHAVQFIEQSASAPEPFFLYVAYTAPHWPLHAMPEDIARYKGRYMDGWDAIRSRRYQRQLEMGIVDNRWPLSPRDSASPPWEEVQNKEDEDLKMAVYAAQVDRMDQGIGRVLTKLQETGLENNTLVIFLSDNGACAEQVNNTPDKAPGPSNTWRSYGLPWANFSNTPFRQFKASAYEGGICTPLIARWPGRIPAGRLTEQTGHVIDLMPTFLEIAGATYPTDFNGHKITPVEGKSILPVLEGKTRAGHEAIFWEHEGNRAVRMDKWKLVALHRGEWELYDLDTDRTETNNLASQQPEKVKDLSARWDNWAAKCGVRPYDEVKRSARNPATTRAARKNQE